MRSFLAAAGSAAALIVLAACSASPPPPPMAAAPQPATTAMPATAVGDIDGVYRGPAGGTSGNSRCGTTMFRSPIRVAGGIASMPSAMNGTLEGPVGADGSLLIEKGRAGLRGQFADGKFNGTYLNGNCTYTLAYSKR